MSGPRLLERGRLLHAARRAGRYSLLTARRTTGPGMFPGFLIVGAQRCGTTSMSWALRQHPAIAGPALGMEVHYFDTGYQHGPAWYRSHFPRLAQAESAAQAAGTAPLAFECSPYYMFHPLAPARIARDLPGVKLLVLLRDPVERAYSAHAHETGIGCETEPFERALELEESRLAGEAERIAADPGYASYDHQHHSYRARGEYAGQLERLAQLVGRDRMHVIDSDDFFTDPEPVFGSVLEFLGQPGGKHPPFVKRNARPRAPMADPTRAALEDHYRPHDERLARWLGHEPAWRRPARIPR